MSKPEDKPRMPDEPITIKVDGLEANLLHDFGRYSSGNLFLAVTDATVKDTETGKQIGNVRGSIGAPAIEVSVYPDGDQSKARAWVLYPETIFRAVLAADEAREKELGDAVQRIPHTE